MTKTIQELQSQNDRLVQALEKWQEAFGELFAQCASNPIKDAWGKPINCTKINEANSLTSNILHDLQITSDDVLRSLASWLGNGGYNAPQVDPQVFEKKIREGVATLVRVECERARKPLEGLVDRLKNRCGQLTRAAKIGLARIESDVEYAGRKCNDGNQIRAILQEHGEV